nr:IS66 family transposase [Deltaproteobacteria bacterium]
MTNVKRIDLTQEQTDSLLLRVKANRLKEGDYEIIKAIIDTLTLLCQAYDEKTTSIKRLLRMIFGARTEKTKNVLDADADNKNVCDDHPDDSFKSADGSNPEDRNDTPGKKRKGHGRNGADTYTGADRIFIPCTKLKHRDPCPLCIKGKVYKMKVPGVVVKIFGRAPVAAKI